MHNRDVKWEELDHQLPQKDLKCECCLIGWLKLHVIACRRYSTNSCKQSLTSVFLILDAHSRDRFCRIFKYAGSNTRPLCCNMSIHAFGAWQHKLYRTWPVLQFQRKVLIDLILKSLQYYLSTFAESSRSITWPGT